MLIWLRVKGYIFKLKIYSRIKIKIFFEEKFHEKLFVYEIILFKILRFHIIFIS